MASQDAEAAAHNAAQHSVLLNRLNRVLAARWLIPTVCSQQRRKPALISANTVDGDARGQVPQPLHTALHSTAQLSINALQQPVQRLSNRTRIGSRIASWSHNNVKSDGQDTSLAAIRFANATLPKIASRRVPHFLGNAQADATVRSRCPNRMHDQSSIGFHQPAIKHCRELIATTQPQKFWKALSAHNFRTTGCTGVNRSHVGCVRVTR